MQIRTNVTVRAVVVITGSGDDDSYETSDSDAGADPNSGDSDVPITAADLEAAFPAKTKSRATQPNASVDAATASAGKFVAPSQSAPAASSHVPVKPSTQPIASAKGGIANIPEDAVLDPSVAAARGGFNGFSLADLPPPPPLTARSISEPQSPLTAIQTEHSLAAFAAASFVPVTDQRVTTVAVSVTQFLPTFEDLGPVNPLLVSLAPVPAANNAPADAVVSRPDPIPVSVIVTVPGEVVLPLQSRPSADSLCAPRDPNKPIPPVPVLPVLLPALAAKTSAQRAH